MAGARPLRVAVVARAVAPLHGVGGLERSVADLVRHLAARAVDVTLITPPPGPVFRSGASDPFGSPHIRVHHIRYLTFPLANRRGTTILDRSTAYLVFGERAGRFAGALAAAGHVDIVHGFGASVLGYARQRARPAPLVLNPQGMEEFGATLNSPPMLKRLAYAPLRWAVRRCARAADCVLATDASLEPVVQRHLHLGPGKVATIPNGVDLAVVTSLAGSPEGAIARQRHGIAADELVLLSVGRLEANKGFGVLASALGRASAARGALSAVPWRWVIVGAGPYRRAIEVQIARAGIGAHVMHAGRASDADLHAWYEAATIFVHPTRYEGSSLVTLEAMAHRKPVIATRAGGLPDKVLPGQNGWLVEPGDAGGLAAAIQEAVLGRAKLAEMGARSRQIVEREFSWTTLVDRQIALYERLLRAASR
jgi:glycosyltransferase involved in cell wall biosynthesis